MAMMAEGEGRGVMTSIVLPMYEPQHSVLLRFFEHQAELAFEEAPGRGQVTVSAPRFIMTRAMMAKIARDGQPDRTSPFPDDEVLSVAYRLMHEVVYVTARHVFDMIDEARMHADSDRERLELDGVNRVEVSFPLFVFNRDDVMDPEKQKKRVNLLRKNGEKLVVPGLVDASGRLVQTGGPTEDSKDVAGRVAARDEAVVNAPVDDEDVGGKSVVEKMTRDFSISQLRRVAAYCLGGMSAAMATDDVRRCLTMLDAKIDNEQAIVMRLDAQRLAAELRAKGWENPYGLDPDASGE